MRCNTWKRAGLSGMLALLACVVPDGLCQDMAPRYLVDAWQVEDGLPQNTVTCMTQTRDGYLWLGTHGGLARFDGARFVVFGAHNTPGIRANRVLTLLADQHDRLWFGTEGGGLTRLESGQFDTFTMFDGLPNNIVRCLGEDARGRVWIGTHTGLCYWEDGRIVAIKDVSGTVRAIACDAAANVWFLVDNSLYVNRSNGSGVMRYDGIVPHPLVDLHTTRSGEVWSVSGKSLLQLRASQDETAPVAIDVPTAPSVVLDSADGDIWIGDREGQLRRGRSNRWVTVSWPEGLVPGELRSLCEDREGNLWVGTEGTGLLRLKPRSLATISASDGLVGDTVLSLAETGDGGIWISTRGSGISLFANGTVRPWTANGAIPQDIGGGPLLKTRDGSLWIGTSGKGLYRWRNGEVRHFGQAEGLSDTAILALYEDAAGSLWIGTYDAGLFRYQEGLLQQFTGADGFPAQIVTSIVEDRDGDLWIGSDGMGLYRYANGRFSYFCRREGWGNDFIKALHVDSDGVLWIGSGGGLTRMKDGWFTTLPPEHGLIDAVVTQILEDDNACLWLGTGRGVCRLDKRDFDAFADGRSPSVEVAAYGKSDGMTSLECTGGLSPSAMKTSDGTLWVPTAMGMVWFDPQTLASPADMPPLMIEEAWIDDNKAMVRTDGLSPLSPLILSPGKERLEIRYTATCFASSEHLRFRHRLVGLNSGWIDVGNERSARYTKLPPDAYRFEVTARAKDGGWNPKAAVLPVTVVPYLWQTRWFPWAVGLLGCVMLAGIVRMLVVRRMRAKLERIRRRHALEQERGRIARDIHDDVGARLTTISLLSSLAERDRHDPEQTAEHIAGISSAVRQVTGALDEVVWAVDPGNDTLDNLASYLCQYVEEFLGETGLRLRLNVPAILPDIPLSSTVRHNIFLVLKEALNNAVKYSDAPTVLFALKHDTGSVEICVEDDGIGFDPASVERGNGLNNMTKRVEELHGSILFESHPGKGCRVTCRIPVS